MCLVLAAWAKQNHEGEIDLDDEETSLLWRVLRGLNDLVVRSEARAVRCKPDETNCDLKGEEPCISRAKRCDGNADCPQAFDEQYCSVLCGQLFGKLTPDQWQKGYYCEYDSKCITSDQLCDNPLTHCPNDPLLKTEDGKEEIAKKCNTERKSWLQMLKKALSED